MAPRVAKDDDPLRCASLGRGRHCYGGGGTEDEAIAALLHDGPEDQGGEKTLADIRLRFGETVATIVGECSDTFEEPKPEWSERKGVTSSISGELTAARCS